MPVSSSRVLAVVSTSSVSSLFRGLDPLVDAGRLDHQCRGEATAGLAHHAPRPHGGRQSAGLGDGQEPVRAARDELDQQPMQPVHRERAGRAELVATVHQEPQRDRQVIDLHQPRRRDPQSDHRRQ
jgi:hypothetical protein